MNLFELMTLNNYGRTKEVLFTSSLSYLLNPLYDHGLGNIFLKIFLKQLEIPTTEKTKVSPEEPLEDKGNVDIYIEMETHIIGVEAKIWDDSAINNSKSDEAQLERYCVALKELSKKKKKEWILVFLIPYKDAPICMEEFEKIKGKGFCKNIKLLTWNNSDGDSEQNETYYLKQSVYEIIKSIIENPTIGITDRTKWILKSMYNYIPNFIKQEKSKSRFPSKNDLKKNCKELMSNLIEPFCKTLNVRINPLHTTIGFPYGVPPAKSEYGNTLFRIRTTKDYYNDIKDKEKNYPDALEIEIWENVYNKIKNDNDWKQWLTGVNCTQLCENVHIDERKKEKIMLLRIEKGTITPEQVNKFNEIMKRGFKELIN